LLLFVDRNLTWERIYGPNGTVYCCWLYNVDNCQDEEGFQNLALGGAILGLVDVLLISGIIISLRLDKGVIGRKHFFLLPLSFFNLFLAMFTIHQFLLYTNGYENSPYGCVIFYLAILCWSLGLIAYRTFLIQTFTELIDFQGEKYVSQTKIYFLGVIITEMILLVLVIMTSDGINQNRPWTDGL